MDFEADHKTVATICKAFDTIFAHALQNTPSPAPTIMPVRAYTFIYILPSPIITLVLTAMQANARAKTTRRPEPEFFGTAGGFDLVYAGNLSARAG